VRELSFLRRGMFFIAVMAVVFSGCAPASKTKKNKIVIWHWMVDRQSAFSELAKEYESQTGVKVEFKLFFPPDIYSQKVIAAARANTLPDIFGILGEKKISASFIKSGHILNMTPYMEADSGKWRNRFNPQTLKVDVFSDNNSYGVPGGIYGVPIDTTVLNFVYNKELFKRAGLNPDSPPKTLGEFINDARIVRDKLGVDGFVCGWGEGWLLNALATEWAINLMGEGKFLKTIKGEVSYTDEDWIKVFSFFSRLKDSGILSSGIATMTNKEAEDAFSKNKAAFSFNGTWAVNVYAQINPHLNYAFFPLPKVSDKFPVKIWGGAGSSFMVNSKSSQKDKAVSFLKWLTADKQQIFLIDKTHNLPAIKGCSGHLPGVLKGTTETFSSLTHPDVWPQNEDSQVTEVINRGLQQIVLGIKKPAEVAKDIQKTKERISHR